MKLIEVKDPFISINKLGEFIYGSDAKKRSILKTNKFPSAFLSARYTSPKSALVKYLVDDDHDRSIFQEKRNQILQQKAISDWSKNNRDCCLLAMDCLVTCADQILVPYLSFIAQRDTAKQYKELQIRGVSIHLNPDVILYHKRTGEITGAIKLVFSKSRTITFQEGEISSGLIKSYIEKVHGVRLNETNCITVDVFHNRSIPAPVELRSITMQAEKACAEIHEIWRTLK